MSYNVKNLTINTILGYVISWLYFFMTLSIFQRIFGSVYGVGINLAISYGIWFIIFYLLNTFHPKGKTQ
jgi:hypothetical protein